MFAEMQSKKKKEKMKQVEVDRDDYDADTMIYGLVLGSCLGSRLGFA